MAAESFAMVKTARILGIAAGSALLCAVGLAPSVTYNGKVLTRDVRMIGGKAYVPLADVAKAMDLQVLKSGGNLALAKAGGANMLAGNTTGKIGEELFTGKWRFLVRDVQKMSEYQETLNINPVKHTAKENEDLIIVTCRVKNGTKQKDELVYSTSWEGTANSLTDMEEHSYAPIAFDVRETEGAPKGVVFLPGAAVDFKMVFLVPKGTEPKDLVFTALRYSMRTLGDQKKEAPQHIRVSLRQ